MNRNLRIGNNVIASVAPGWLLIGRVADIDGSVVKFNPAMWSESLSAPWTEAAWDKNKITKGHAIKGDLDIQITAILWVADASQAVVGKPQTDAIEGIK